MAASRSSRPKADMLSGLGNINGRARNFIKTEEEAPEEETPKTESTVKNTATPAKKSRVEENINPPVQAPVAEQAPVQAKAPSPAPTPVQQSVAVAQPAKKPGRPRKFKEGEKTEVIGVRLLDNEVRFLEEYGGKFGGKTGYVTYLIREEMKRLNVGQ